MFNRKERLLKKCRKLALKRDLIEKKRSFYANEVLIINEKGEK